MMKKQMKQMKAFTKNSSKKGFLGKMPFMK